MRFTFRSCQVAAETFYIVYWTGNLSPFKIRHDFQPPKEHSYDQQFHPA